jgi:hypothetical protein
VFSFTPIHALFLIQKFPPFLANGLGVKVSSMLLLLSGILSTSPNIVYPLPPSLFCTKEAFDLSYESMLNEIKTKVLGLLPI